MTVKPICFVAAIFMYLMTQAQQIHVGVTTDFNLTKMNGKGLSSKWQTGYNGGGYVLLGINKKWSLQPELLYTLKNVEKADNFTTYYVNSGRSFANTNINLHYISFPVLLNYRVSHLLTVNAGPEYNVMVYSDDDLVKTNKSAFKKNEAGVNAGLQVTFSPAFNLFGSYYYGLSNANNIDDRYQWHDNQVRIGINCRLF